MLLDRIPTRHFYFGIGALMVVGCQPDRRPLQAHEAILVFCGELRKATYNPQRVFRPKIKPGGRRV